MGEWYSIGLSIFEDAAGAVDVGRGTFFDANLADIKASRRKSTMLRRCVEKDIDVMRSDNRPSITSLVLDKLRTCRARRSLGYEMIPSEMNFFQVDSSGRCHP